VELVSVLVYDRRRLTIERAKDLKESAEMHRRIYAAIGQRDAKEARREMEYHLDTARLNQLLEGEEPTPAIAGDEVVAPRRTHARGGPVAFTRVSEGPKTPQLRRIRG
jgi:GntR family transcriptional repressor for pyruvate dehydrogenase complex